MKKIVCLVLFVFVLLNCTALAENEINLPAGLKFGLSLDESVAISGYDKRQGAAWVAEQIKKMGFPVEEYIFGQATIGGYEAYVSSFFDHEGLKQVEYELLIELGSEDKAKAECQKVRNALTTKYGDCVGEEKSQHQYSPVSGVNYKNKYVDYRRIGFSDLSTWIVLLDDGGSVYIDLYYITEWIDETTKYSIKYPMYITYTYYDFQIDSTEVVSTVVDF